MSSQEAASLLLGVPHGASKSELKTAYQKKAKEHHPDKCKDKNPEMQKFFNDNFCAISAAYKFLLEFAPPQRQPPQESWSRPPQPPPQYAPPPPRSAQPPRYTPPQHHRDDRKRKSTHVVEIDGVPLTKEELEMIRRHRARAKKHKNFR